MDRHQERRDFRRGRIDLLGAGIPPYLHQLGAFDDPSNLSRGVGGVVDVVSHEHQQRVLDGGGLPPGDTEHKVPGRRKHGTVELGQDRPILGAPPGCALDPLVGPTAHPVPRGARIESLPFRAGLGRVLGQADRLEHDAPTKPLGRPREQLQGIRRADATPHQVAPVDAKVVQEGQLVLQERVPPVAPLDRSARSAGKALVDGNQAELFGYIIVVVVGFGSRGQPYPRVIR
mmetsp:Transcript_26610/g.73213  ORF Transcript_26610/g.73213 Transcript_26610/m.73213 type:complete len:231 (-) Transcript_26610:474-1166(-)